MARGRMINQTISEDIEFNSMSIEAQLMFVRTVPFLDRDGLTNGHPAILVGKVAPLLTDMFGKMPAIIDEWIEAGLVIRYLDGKVTVLYFKGFTQNQVGMRYDREPESQFSVPPGYTRTPTGIEKLPPTDGNNTDDSGNPTPEITPPNTDCDSEMDEFRNIAGTLLEDFPLKRREENKIKNNRAPACEAKRMPEESPPSAVVVDTASVFDLWQNNMPGSLTPLIVDEINDFIDTYGVLEVDTAIRKAVSANKRSSRYIAGILRNRAAGTEPTQRHEELPPVMAGVSGELGFSLRQLSGGVM